MDAPRRIKDLSIALEALSRINRPDAADLFEAVQSSLKKEIDNLTKEQHPIKTARSAEPTLDDDIPF